MRIAMVLAGVAAACVLGALGVTVIFMLIRRRPAPPSVEEARAAFEAQRATLERLFVDAASATGKPRGLRWKSCEFGPEFEIARDRRNGELLAFIPVTIAFEAIPGSDMEGLPAVGNLRSASAVFTWRGRRWITAGRAVFNLAPAEAIRHFRAQYEAVGPEPSSPSADPGKTV
jgi:hypothetical protein